MKVWETDAWNILSQSSPDDPYLNKAYDFAKSWVEGQWEFVLNTSGSTGVPKEIQVTRKQLASSARMTGEILKLGRGTRALVCLNIGYVAGLMMLVRGMELGWNLTIIEPTSNPLLELGESRDFDFVAMVPVQLAACLDNELTKNEVERFGKILLGGATVSASLQSRIENLSIPVYQSYGMTETVSHIALRRLNGSDSTGYYKVLPGISFGLDTRGCLFVSGEVTNGETIQTNDLAEITSATTFRWIGRTDNIINSGGVKIVLDAVDQVIADIFFKSNYSQSFFCWYQKDEKLGEKLVLIVEGDAADLDESVLLAEIRKRISAYEIPKHVYFVDRFERTPTDKIDKRLTAALLLQL